MTWLSVSLIPSLRFRFPLAWFYCSLDSTATIKHPEKVNNSFRLLCRLALWKGILVCIAKMKDTLKIVPCSWFLAVEGGLHTFLFMLKISLGSYCHTCISVMLLYLLALGAAQIEPSWSWNELHELFLRYKLLPCWTRCIMWVQHCLMLSRPARLLRKLQTSLLSDL